MSDNTNNTGSPDRDRISTSEDYEVRYWSEKFGVSKEALIEAVKASGSNSPEKVEAYLRQQR
ncbi:DUF3606 domain-containing protein [Flavobacterium sp. Sd200]|uniref:DUF3606 domain-containing protein n=1 Tax=Flavobacterium sp. Sd200 TaxID=2692211 RepID=UPI00136CFE91|nr:DUF3606 domain-containing protein [Flavobacterium sp. Sd200]MXN91709.1 DUF3606 domain-containing protein [Flavobacterium sp. Sd200]